MSPSLPLLSKLDTQHLILPARPLRDGHEANVRPIRSVSTYDHLHEWRPVPCLGFLESCESRAEEEHWRHRRTLLLGSTTIALALPLSMGTDLDVADCTVSGMDNTCFFVHDRYVPRCIPRV